jgi:hypothetical protein
MKKKSKPHRDWSDMTQSTWKVQRQPGQLENKYSLTKKFQNNFFLKKLRQ